MSLVAVFNQTKFLRSFKYSCKSVRLPVVAALLAALSRTVWLPSIRSLALAVFFAAALFLSCYGQGNNNFFIFFYFFHNCVRF
jgi:hypothetical protein